MNTYEVLWATGEIITPPLRDEKEAHTYAIGWYRINIGKTIPLMTIRIHRRGVVPHDLSTGTSEC